MRTNITQNTSSTVRLILEGIVIGLMTFWAIYGFGPLDVTNDRWIMTGYDESDIIQHYAGWCAFEAIEKSL